MEETSGWSIDADLAIAPMEALGWRVTWVPWRAANTDWAAFDAVYLAAPWDYPGEVRHFMATLERIDQSRAVLVNDLSLVRWNIAKTYLRDLEMRGALIVPSLWPGSLVIDALDGYFAHFGSECLIVKPVISTNATDTFLLDREVPPETQRLLHAAFADRPFVVQPFVGAVQDEGEYSLFYIGQRYSHAIRKIPKRGDFRVQEEHGAGIEAVHPPRALRDTADGIMNLVDPAPVYARCDLVRGHDGRYLLMELELIEPSMYLRMDSAAPGRFASALDRYVARASAS